MPSKPKQRFLGFALNKVALSMCWQYFLVSPLKRMVERISVFITFPGNSVCLSYCQKTVSHNSASWNVSPCFK